MKNFFLINVAFMALCLLNSCVSGPKVKEFLIYPNAKIPIAELYVTSYFMGGTVYILPKDRIEIKRVEDRRGRYFTGIRKEWDSGEYLNEIECPLELLISYAGGSWARAEMDEKTKIIIRNGRIGVVGTINLRKSMSYYEGDNINFNNAMLIHETVHKFDKKCPDQTSWHYELDRVNDYYIVKAPEKNEQIALIGILNTSIVLCSKIRK